MLILAKRVLQARRLEGQANGPSLADFIADGRENSHTHGGRSVFGWEPPPTVPAAAR